MCYSIDLRQGERVVERCASLLDARERTNASSRRAPDVARRYVVAHGALRLILAAHTGIDAAALRYRYRCAVCGSHEHGRPELADGALSFNLSHSRDVAVVAVAPERVGVDVEVIRPRRYLDRLAARVMATTGPVELIDFLAAWTAKEASLKRIGVGLTQPLADVPTQDAHTWTDWPAGCVTSVVAPTRPRFATDAWVP